MTDAGAPTIGTDAADLGLRQQVMDIGRSLGLDAVGTCGAEPFDGTRAVLEERRAAGLDGGMQFTYRNPARSTDPAVTLAGSRSLVVGAIHHAAAVPDPPAGPQARIARYARADDYARLRSILTEIAVVLREAGHRAIVSADENSLVDRAAAHRAGLGWYGKNANILLPGQGSWFLLGSVLTTADLGPSPEPVADGCGTCRRCLDGCPTGAIIAPGVVDGGRCLSWLLQRTGDFPRRFRRALGDRIYGCDDCQEVCPPTRRRGDPEDHRDPEDLRDVANTVERRGPDATGTSRSWIDVGWLLTATDDEVMERVDRWYIPERDPRYIRRNALVVLGNTGRRDDPRTESWLRTYLSSGDDLLVGHAAWAALALGLGGLLDDPRWRDRPVVQAELAAARAGADDSTGDADGR